MTRPPLACSRLLLHPKANERSSSVLCRCHISTNLHHCNIARYFTRSSICRSTARRPVSTVTDESSQSYRCFLAAEKSSPLTRAFHPSKSRTSCPPRLPTASPDGGLSEPTGSFTLESRTYPPLLREVWEESKGRSGSYRRGGPDRG